MIPIPIHCPSPTYLIPIRRARIIHHNIQAAKLLVRELDQRLPVRLFRHVGAHELAAQLARGLLPDVLDEVRDDHFRALLQEGGRDALAKAAAAAGHDGDFGVELALGHLVCCCFLGIVRRGE